MRRAGVLMPVFSLPSPYGIGTLGRAAYGFVDFLAASGQSLWQILPMNPTGPSGSPYQCLSAFAGNPLAIDLDLLAGEGLLQKRELKQLRDSVRGRGRVCYALQQKLKVPLLFKAAGRMKEGAGFRKFIRDNAWWLSDVAGRFPEVAETAQRIQYLYAVQWQGLKRYANARGIAIVGDLPFYIGGESADFHAHPELFRTDRDGRPDLIAGVPPDAFSKDGQIWNEPVYDWAAHRRSGYEWWLNRFKQASVLYDCVRVDHFRAFARFYAIPAGRPAKDGAWVEGPGRPFIDAVRKAVPGLGVIAEDLGIITDDVHELREYSGYPGMRVLQFAFAPGEDSAYLPHNHVPHCVVYTGTHDNPTLVEWTRTAGGKEIAYACDYLGTTRGNLPHALVRAALSSVAETVIIPLQDYMGLGASARVNTPGTVTSRNWTWRLQPGDLTAELRSNIRVLSEMYGRS
jgi:4-alpha-glucanotransferase